MSAIHCSTRAWRTLSELTFHVANLVTPGLRSGRGMWSCQVARWALRRGVARLVEGWDSTASGGAGVTAAFFAAAFFAAAFFAAAFFAAAFFAAAFFAAAFRAVAGFA